MKIMVIGASGTLGSSIVRELEKDHEVIKVGKTRGDIQVDLTSDESVKRLFAASGKLDAVIAATGNVDFTPITSQSIEQFSVGLQDKLMGQVRLVLHGQRAMNPGGSFTLTTGILAQQPIPAGVSATTANNALEGFVLAAANELRPLRINAVSPTVLTESLESYGPFFAGFESVDAARAALAYRRSVEGLDSGKVYRVW